MSQSSYDVFLSYARTDDRDIQFVSKLAKEMQRAFQSFTGRQLRIFVDTREIATAEIWQESIKRALENSTVMVAALTPSYFTSEWCGREWDHFRDQEERHRRQIGLPASRSLIFPVQFVSLDKVLDPGNEARRRMSEAAHVTLLGIAHGSLTGFLDEALERKRRRQGPGAFWSSIRVVFASEALLPLVHDDLDAEFPDREAAIRVRFQRAGRGRRAVASFFLLSDHPREWSMYEYRYLMPFVGALFEMSDGSKVAQVATFRPRRGPELPGARVPLSWVEISPERDVTGTRQALGLAAGRACHDLLEPSRSR